MDRAGPPDFAPQTEHLKRSLASWLWTQCKSSPDTATRVGKLLDVPDLHCSKDELTNSSNGAGSASLDRLAEVCTWNSRDGSPFHRIRRVDEYRRWGAFRRRGRRRPVLRLYKINGCAAAYERDPAAEADRIALTEHQLQGFRGNHWAADLFRDRARGHRLLFSGFGSSEPQYQLLRTHYAEGESDLRGRSWPEARRYRDSCREFSRPAAAGPWNHGQPSRRRSLLVRGLPRCHARPRRALL